MKLITRYALAAMETTELQALYRKVARTLACTKPDTLERTNALASLENICRELATRYEP
jgi:hypothetical protein